MKPGFYPDIDNEAYHAGPGTSSSNLKKILQGTGLAYQYGKAHPRPSTPAMQLGTAVHTLVLEPDKAAAEIAVEPQGINKRTNAGKEEYAAWQAENAGKLILSPADYERGNCMRDSVHDHPTAGIVLADCVVESSIYQQYNGTSHDDMAPYSELIKVRPDALSRSHSFIVDLKTAGNASMAEFARSAVRFMYHLSAAMYLHVANNDKDALKACGHKAFTNFLFVVVENEPPYQTALYELSADDLGLGRQLFEQAMYKLHCAKRDGWPGYPDEIRTLELPAYARNYKRHLTGVQIMSTELTIELNPNNPTERAMLISERTFALEQRHAQALASSKLIPAAFQGNLPDCMIALEMAQRMNTGALEIMQNLYVVHGKPGFSSTYLIARINQSGIINGRLRFEYTGDIGKDNRGCTAVGVDAVTGDELRGTQITVDMAKRQQWYSRNGSKWPDMTEQMLAYRAAAFWSRIYAPDATMGFHTVDELRDNPVEKEVNAAPSANEALKATKPKRTRKPKAEPKPEPEPEPKPKPDIEYSSPAAAMAARFDASE